MTPPIIRRTASDLLGLALIVMGTGCAVNPATGQRQLSLVSEAQEVQLGREAAQDVQASLGLLDDDQLQSYVERVGKRLAARSERPNLPWSFQVVDDPTPNAFALPGGFIYVTRGLLALLTSEAQLAAVLGHEIGHVTARHSVSQISKAQLAQLGFGLGGILFPETQQLAPAIGAGLELLFLKYGRDDERQADEVGYRYLRDGGYSTSEADDVFAALERAGGEQRSALPNWLSTHPSPAERVKTAQARAAQEPASSRGTVGEEAYLRQIDDLPYGENPRVGFFKNGVFYHPELRFQIRFPEGWQARNLAQAVVAIEPNGQAAMELTLAGRIQPAAALSRFLNQEGVRAGRTSQQRIQGLPAAIAEFEAQTPDGVLGGLIGYVQHRNATYQILGYSSASLFARYDTAFNRVIGTFTSVNDPAILSVQPRRIDLVEVDRDQTLEQLARAHPSAVPVQQLAIINQVDGANSRIAAGSLFKRVI
jgi:predicted Zn-dependent protease